MSYEKQTWATGDVITAEKLNHIESGIYNNSERRVEIIDYESAPKLNITCLELYNLLESGDRVVAVYIDEYGVNFNPIIRYSFINSVYRFYIYDYQEERTVSYSGRNDDQQPALPVE